MLLEAGEDFVTIKEARNEDDGQPDLHLSMDRSKLMSVGKPAIEKFLIKLQVYKSTGNFEAASQVRVCPSFKGSLRCIDGSTGL